MNVCLISFSLSFCPWLVAFTFTSIGEAALTHLVTPQPALLRGTMLRTVSPARTTLVNSLFATFSHSGILPIALHLNHNKVY